MTRTCMRKQPLWGCRAIANWLHIIGAQYGVGDSGAEGEHGPAVKSFGNGQCSTLGNVMHVHWHLTGENKVMNWRVI